MEGGRSSLRSFGELKLRLGDLHRPGAWQKDKYRRCKKESFIETAGEMRFTATMLYQCLLTFGAGEAEVQSALLL